MSGATHPFHEPDGGDENDGLPPLLSESDRSRTPFDDRTERERLAELYGNEWDPNENDEDEEL